ncbi:MAG: aspartate aminotransferase family protein [Bradymonadales bacterium]|nr:aspartate aminotransferase family protein [Bradymonadales bacterium]
MKRIPEQGRDREQLIAEMEEFRQNDANYREAKTWSLVYFLGDDHTEFLKRCYGLYFSENALNPMAFSSLKRFESEVVSMTASMLHGDQQVVGTMTSGGTESCLLAVKTYRDRARKRWRIWTGKPEMIAPETVHVAFEKAAEYFDVKMVHARVDRNYQVDVKSVARLINRNTALIVASAPCYPFGVVDPIDQLSRLALKHRIPLHVDACLGGFLLPWVERLGYPVPPFDFRLPGVTSITADIHKYGFAAKGASVILYRNQDYLKHQFFIHTDWAGGIYASPALLGTRPGGAIAAAWAAMQALGEEGYLDLARTTMDTTRKLIDGIGSLPEIEVLGQPHMSVFAYRSRTPEVSIYAVGDQMERRGWHIDRQQKPESLHAMVTPGHARVVDRYLADLKESVATVKGSPNLYAEGQAAMYGMISKIPLRGLIKNNVLKMMLEMYGPQGSIPDLGRQAEKEDLATRLGRLFLRLRH